MRQLASYHDMRLLRELGLVVSCHDPLECQDLRVRYSKTAIQDSISIIASSTVGTPCPPPVVYRLKKEYKNDNPAMNVKWLYVISLL